MTEADLNRALDRRKATRILHTIAAQARISAEWARRADDARAYRERMGYDAQG